MTKLVLLPGLDGTGCLFAPFLTALGNEVQAQIIRYPHDRVLGYPELTQWVEQKLPSGEPFYILGESFSGPIAIALAAQNPQGLRGLILCCTFASNPRPALAWTRSLLPFIPFRWTSTFALDQALLYPQGTPELRQAIARAVSSVEPRVLQSRLKAVLAIDVQSQIAAIKSPCLLLSAKRDRLVPAQAHACIRASLAEARFLELDGPHALLQVLPTDTARAVICFIQEVESKAA